MGARPVHFEFYSADPAASVAFFEEALGWSFSRYADFDYWLATTGDEPPGIDGAVGALAPGDTGPYTMNTVQVAGLERAIETCEQAGGTLSSGIQEIPGVGRRAGIREPGGNEFGLFEPISA